MPALVGGFGNTHKLKICSINEHNSMMQRFQPVPSILRTLKGPAHNLISNSTSVNAHNNSNYEPKHINNIDKIGAYLAGLIEGDGTFAIHDQNSTAKKYFPMIIIVFKKEDLPLAQYLQNLTRCGSIYLKPNRGYVLWQIQDIVSVFRIVTLINGYMRTPKIEALHRTIKWLNNYIKINQESKLLLMSKKKLILSEIYPLEIKPLDTSPIDSNAWLSGFTDARGNFSINIHKRSNRNSTRVQLFFRLEITQNYHRLDPDGIKVSFFSIMSIIANYFNVNVYSRSRVIKDKQYYSFIIMAYNNNSLFKIIEYFNKFPLLSSKYLDFKDWTNILELQKANPQTTSYLEIAINTRKNFNSTRTTYNWNHLKNCYIN